MAQPATPQPIDLDPRAVLAELARMPQVETHLELAEERAARKHLQQLYADQSNEISQLRAKADTEQERADATGAGHG